MHIQFDSTQEHQVNAINAVVSVFDGRPRANTSQRSDFMLGAISLLANPDDLDWAQALENVRAVQKRHDLPVSESLLTVEGDLREAGVTHADADFPNFSLEMETGTGKTYVYFRTALELYQRYGFRKFIVVVPSIAIREGVMTTFRQTKAHFDDLYSNPPYEVFSYDSSRVSQVRDFAQSNGLMIMVTTIQAFQAAETVLRQSPDHFFGQRPLDLIRATRPVIILDEPQNMKTAERLQALADLKPLFALRYSATHANPYTLLYRLTPLEAYRKGLVKKIEVAGLTDTDASRPYIKLAEVNIERNTFKAKLLVDKINVRGEVRRASVTVKPNRRDGDLTAKSGNPVYQGLFVEQIDTDAITLSDTTVLNLNQEIGPNKETLFRAQIRYTIEEHFLKQRRLQDKAVKVLSLFFLDRVSSYVGENGSTGIVQRLFDEEFALLTGRYPEWAGVDPGRVRAAYFAQQPKRGGAVEFFESENNEKARAAFRAQYELIMRNKEGLLSFAEPAAFIFSHSALREGWDNPNIFQICTLNQSISTMRKRQEIGRGVRLCVDQAGARLTASQYNRLTVVANEAYREYIGKLQTEINADGLTGGAPTPDEAGADHRPRGKVTLSKNMTDPDFLALWERIKQRTYYLLEIDSEQLVREASTAMDQEQVEAVSVQVSRVLLEADGDTLVGALQVEGKVVLAHDNLTLPDIFGYIEHLLSQGTPPVRLTRQTILEVFRNIRELKGLRQNPQGYLATLTRVLREKLASQLVDKIKYLPSGEWYEATELFDEEYNWYADSVKSSYHDGTGITRTLEKCMYDGVRYESNVESNFVDELERSPEVLLYVKLPGKFKVPTPLGGYNPDWAVVARETDSHGSVVGTKLYFVHETKGVTNFAELRLREQQNIQAGTEHFKTIGVTYQGGPHLRGAKTLT